jgi:hypothetical protein
MAIVAAESLRQAQLPLRDVAERKLDPSAVHVSAEALEAGLGQVLASPKDAGIVELIVCRPSSGQRQTVTDGLFDRAQGLIGDNWLQRGNARTPDRQADPNAQLTLMNSRATALIACSKDRWALAGDQLFVNFDLSVANLPVDSLVKVGEATIVITANPHLGCAKFLKRFGEDAMEFVNSPRGRELRLRGVNAKIVEGGRIRVGDVISRIDRR